MSVRVSMSGTPKITGLALVPQNSRGILESPPPGNQGLQPCPTCTFIYPIQWKQHTPYISVLRNICTSNPDPFKYQPAGKMMLPRTTTLTIWNGCAGNPQTLRSPNVRRDRLDKSSPPLLPDELCILDIDVRACLAPPSAILGSKVRVIRCDGLFARCLVSHAGFRCPGNRVRPSKRRQSDPATLCASSPGL